VIRRARFDPLAQHLDGVEDLTVIPSGTVLGIPWEAVPDASGRFLGEIYDITYAPSATIHAWAASMPPAAGRATLLVGDPAIPSSAAEEEIASAARQSREREACLRALLGPPDSLRLLPRLPWSRREVEEIATLFPDTRILVGPDASEAEVRRLEAGGSGGMSSFRIVHIATHALVDDIRPALSCLVLSQDAAPSFGEAPGHRTDDGLLRAREIASRWVLDADLVTLSACRTGLGLRVGGRRYLGFATASLPSSSEGYVGFAQCFLAAGARRLLLSMWKVDDRATMLLMKRFYENSTGRYDGERAGRRGPLSTGVALREARTYLRTYRDAAGESIYAHPHYWAAFILMGPE
jgi:CHAT domain-containing protein